jgi:hypothetical protein
MLSVNYAEYRKVLSVVMLNVFMLSVVAPLKSIYYTLV